jgi:hypothetical protein
MYAYSSRPVHPSILASQLANVTMENAKLIQMFGVGSTTLLYAHNFIEFQEAKVRPKHRPCAHLECSGICQETCAIVPAPVNGKRLQKIGGAWSIAPGKKAS